MRDTKRAAWWRIGEWGSTCIFAGRTGWTIEYRSRTQGARTGRVLHVPYGHAAILAPRGVDLSEWWNPTCTRGEALARWAVPGGAGVRVLRHGEVAR